MSNDTMINAEALTRFEARQSDDEVKTDLELTCTDCDEVICDIEPGDSLDVLASTALGHKCGSKDFEEIAEAQGWNTDSMLAVVRGFISERGLSEQLGERAAEVAAEENGS